MALVKDGVVVEDIWAHAEDDDDLDAFGGPVFVSLELWQSTRDRLSGRNAPLGLRLTSDQSPELVAQDLGRFEAIALEFPKFTDGRAYSHARILRERLGFRGELRAVGNILRDQLLFMHRCGFDAFEIADPDAAASWSEALGDFSVWYQPTGDDRVAAARLRHLRRAAE